MGGLGFYGTTDRMPRLPGPDPGIDPNMPKVRPGVDDREREAREEAEAVPVAARAPLGTPRSLGEIVTSPSFPKERSERGKILSQQYPRWQTLGDEEREMLLNAVDRKLAARAAPPSGPPNLRAAGEGMFQKGQGWLRAANEFLAKARQRTGEMMIPSHVPPEAGVRRVAEIANPVPGSVPQAALQLGMAGMGPSAGGRVAQVVKGAAKGATAGAGMYAGGEFLAGGGAADIAREALVGGTAGTVGGTLVGTGHAMGLSRASTRKATEAMESITKDTASSGPVRAPVQRALDQRQPALLLHPETPRQMKAARSAEFDRAVEDVQAMTGGQLYPMRTVENMVDPPFPIPTAQIVPSRNVATTGRGALMDVKEVQRWVAALRQQPKREAEARAVEQELERHLPAAARQRYSNAIKQYAADSRAIETVEHVQSEYGFGGGVSAASEPSLARAQRAVELGPEVKGRMDPTTAGHAAAAALVPSPGARSYHGLTALARRFGGAGFDPLGVVGHPPVSRTREMISPTAGKVAAEMLSEGPADVMEEYAGGRKRKRPPAQ